MIEMRRNIVLCTIALVLFLAYFYVSTISSLYSAAFPAPKWWSPLFPTHLSAALSWMILRHAAAVLLAATPFSLLCDLALSAPLAPYCHCHLPCSIRCRPHAWSDADLRGRLRAYESNRPLGRSRNSWYVAVAFLDIPSLVL